MKWTIKQEQRDDLDKKPWQVTVTVERPDTEPVVLASLYDTQREAYVVATAIGSLLTLLRRYP